MALITFSFFAWILTILAPCVLPLLPVIIGRTAVGSARRLWTIIWSFAVSILIFTLFIKRIAFTLGLRPEILTKISAGILLFFGVIMLFPNLWQWLMTKTWIEHAVQSSQSTQKAWLFWDVLLWFSLWPVFNSCSPTYAVLVATILPQSFIRWVTNIIAYILWLCLMMTLIAWWGRKIVKKFRWAANPTWWFKRILAGLLIVVWLAIRFGIDKDVEARLIQEQLFLDTTAWEQSRATQFKKDFKNAQE